MAAKKRRKFFHTLITISIVSEDSHPGMEDTVADIERQITDGDWLGEISMGQPVRVSQDAVASLCRSMGSEPEFFQLDDRGRSTRWERT
jgi:hypothetical protein